MGWYAATIPFAWAYLACASYGYFQRKYRIIADITWFGDSVLSLILAALASSIWPLFVPVFYFALCERHKYGFAIPFTDPFKKERQNGNRQAIKASQSGPAHSASSGAGGAGANQNSGGAGKGTGQGGLTNAPVQMLAYIQQQRALAQALQQQHAHGLTQVQTMTSFPQGGGGYMSGQAIGNQGAGMFGGIPGASMVEWSPPDPLPTTTVFGELIGWRSWRVLKGAVLTSCVVADVWLPGVPMEGPILDEHQSGGMGEGIHAYKQEPHKSVYAERQDGYVYATGSVWLYGDVIEHENGYRADHAMVRSIDAVTTGDQALLAKLRERYLPRPAVLGKTGD